MSSLKNLVKSAHEGHHLVVTEPHSQWMELPEHEQVYSEAAITHIGKVLRRQYKVNRIGRFSPSGVGKCARRLAYGYAGAPQTPFEAGTAEIVEHGTWTHLKWQAEGLSMGYMLDAETWVEDGDLVIGGSIDGLLWDESVFELKSAAPSVYTRQVLTAGEPHEEYLEQSTAYMMLLGLSWTSLVYEDRAYGNFHEYRYEMDSKRERALVRNLVALKKMVEADELPEPFDECVMRTGKLFKGCPYRKVCHKLNSVSAAREAGKVTDDQIHVFDGSAPLPWPSENPGWLE